MYVIYRYVENKILLLTKQTNIQYLNYKWI